MSRNKDLQHALNTQSNAHITWQKSFFYVFFFIRVVEVFFPSLKFRKKNSKSCNNENKAEEGRLISFNVQCIISNTSRAKIQILGSISRRLLSLCSFPALKMAGNPCNLIFSTIWKIHTLTQTTIRSCGVDPTTLVQIPFRQPFSKENCIAQGIFIVKFNRASVWKQGLG